MSLLQSRKLKIASAWLVLAIAGAAVGWFARAAREREMIGVFYRGATRATIAFGAGELRQLSGTPADLGSPVYAAVKLRLQQFKAVDTRVRSITIVRRRSDGGFVTLVDTSAPGEPGQSPPGSEYPRAAWPAIERARQTGESRVVGPYTDAKGTWITGFAVVGGKGAASVPTATDVLVLQAEALDWNRALWLAAFQAAFYVWILLGLPYGAWLVMRRQIEQREVIRNLSEAMEQSRSAIMIVDLEGRIEYANRGLCQQLGFVRRELIGRKWREFHVAGEQENELNELLAAARAGRMWEGEWLNRRKDGTTYPVRGMITPVQRRSGALSCLVAVFDDITETKRREAELRDARDHAQAGDRAKGQFLATMSHEVRTPLNGIVGFTSLLLDTPLSAEQREYVQTIKMSTEALIQLTGDILDFARIESGKLNLDPLACDPREAVEDALDLLAARAAEKKIELLHHFDADVPSAIVTDGGRLRQVLVNLVGNAVKFTERGEIEVSISVMREPRAETEAEGTAAPNRRACELKFSVRDTGIGIAPSHHDKLFRPFTQVDESTTRRYGGTGLGLAICRNLVELMGGTISVASEPGRGSTFTFTIVADVAAPLPPERNLGGLRVGLAVRSAPLRRELSALVRSWHGEVIEVDSPEELANAEWQMGIAEIDEALAAEVAAGPGRLPPLPPQKTIGLVPISLSNELRTALRSHFRLLINKPVHHSAFFALLSGSRSTAPIAPPPTRFGFRILVVEDNPVNQRLIERVVANLGCTSTLVTNGRHALEQLKQRAEDFDLVLLDLHMPEMDGLTALREIRAGHAGVRAQTIWIIALTADARDQQRASGLEAGLNDYLTKPINLTELEAALRRFRNDRLARKH